MVHYSFHQYRGNISIRFSSNFDSLMYGTGSYIQPHNSVHSVMKGLIGFVLYKTIGNSFDTRSTTNL